MLGTVISFALGPWGKMAGAGIGLLLALGGVFVWHKTQVWQASRAGYASAISDIKAANERAMRRADEATITVQACHQAGDKFTWNRENGRCEKLP